MKKTLLSSLLVVCLSGCSAHSNQINCQKIDIETKDGHYVVSGEHKERFDYVYEYLGPDFKPLYLDGVYMCKVVGGLGHDTGPYPIKVYETEGSKDYVEYIYNRNVGPIWSVHSYYLNMKTRTVEYECVRDDTALSYSHFTGMDGAEEAFECAHKDFYHYQGRNLYLDKAYKGLEYHIWYSYDENAKVEFTQLGDEQSSNNTLNAF